jgi:hypothetical protein
VLCVVAVAQMNAIERCANLIRAARGGSARVLRGLHCDDCEFAACTCKRRNRADETTDNMNGEEYLFTSVYVGRRCAV